MSEPKGGRTKRPIRLPSARQARQGPAAGKIPVGLDNAILEYYGTRGWDFEGKPTPELIHRLGMEDFTV